MFYFSVISTLKRKKENDNMFFVTPEVEPK